MKTLAEILSLIFGAFFFIESVRVFVINKEFKYWRDIKQSGYLFPFLIMTIVLVIVATWR
jgi:hypothetical protein